MDDFEIFFWLKYLFEVKTQQTPVGGWLNSNIYHPSSQGQNKKEVQLQKMC